MIVMMIFMIIVIATIIIRKPGDQTEEFVLPHSSLGLANQPIALGSDENFMIMMIMI